MKALVIERFRLEATLFQPVFDHMPSLGCTSSERMHTFEKGEIIELKKNFYPSDEETDNCASVHGGRLVFKEPVPMRKVVIISDANCEIANMYHELYGNLQELEEQLKLSEYQAMNAEDAINDAETIDDVVSFFRFYSRNSAEAALRRMDMESMRLKMLSCENKLKNGRRVTVVMQRH